MKVSSLYKRHRFPPEIISRCVWLSFHFPLSYRDSEELMSTQGVALTYETVRLWCWKFGQVSANQLRHPHTQPGDKWHLDEVFLTIKGQQYYLWRAVDQHGSVLGALVQSRRDQMAAKRFFRKLLKEWQVLPRVIVTDKLASYRCAKQELMASVEHRLHKEREYSSGKLAPTDTAARTEDAAFQIGRTCSTLRCSL